jgi:choline kinase
VADEIVKQISFANGDVILPMDTAAMDAESMKIQLKDGKVTDISKDIPLGKATGESIPLMKFSALALSGLRELIGQRLQKNMLRAYLEAPLLELIKNKALSVNVVDVTGWRWQEIDTQRDLASAIALFGKQA